MRWVVIGVAALLVGLLAYGIASQDQRTTATAALQPGETPPMTDAELPVLGSEAEGAIADYRGQVVLVNFWASWCKPCEEELPLLQKAQGALTDAGATVLGVISRDNSEASLKFVDDYGLTFPSLRDLDDTVGEEWGVAQLPESFLLDRDGKVAAVVQGPITQEFIDEEVLPLARRS